MSSFGPFLLVATLMAATAAAVVTEAQAASAPAPVAQVAQHHAHATQSFQVASQR